MSSPRRHYLLATVFLATIVTAILGCRHDDNTDQFHALPHPAPGNALGHTRYVVFLPRDKFQMELLPVILFLNGWGQNGNDGLRQVSNNFGQDVWRRRNQLPFLAVCPQCSEDGYWNPGGPDTAAALQCLDNAIERFGGDPDRVYVTGTSSGGHGAMEFASAYPDRFAGVFPVAAGPPGDPQVLAAARMPIWCIVNRKDAKHRVELMRKSRRRWLQAGLSPIVIEADRRSGNFHNAWDEAYGPTVAYSWLLQQRLSENKQQELFTLSESKEILKSWDQRGSAAWTINKQGELLGTTKKGRGMLVSPSVTGETEWHLDVFLKGAQRLRLGLFAEEPRREITDIILELPEIGSGGIRGPDGRWLATLDPMGQQALDNGWNDIRISRKDGRIQFRINGWPAGEFKDPTSGQSLRWALIASHREPTRVRFIRQRGGLFRPVEARKP